MTGRTRITGALILAGALVLGAAYLAIGPDRALKTARPADLLITLSPLPDRHTLDGEAIINGMLQPLTLSEHGLSAAGAPDALILRLQDGQARYYDIEIARTIRLAGLAPRTPVTLSSDDGVVHHTVPANWNGMIVLDTPPTAPFYLSFSRHDHHYRLGIMNRIGSAS